MKVSVIVSNFNYGRYLSSALDSVLAQTYDDLEIIAPKVLTRPWKTTRIFFRQRARKFDIVEGVCLEGYYVEKTDKDGNAVFVYTPHNVGGNRIAPP